jgi:diguanylate cyclase (GGDEF)-like protein
MADDRSLQPHDVSTLEALGRSHAPTGPPGIIVAFAGIALAIAVAVADHAAGPLTSLAILYAVPVAATAWLADRSSAVTVALMAIVADLQVSVGHAAAPADAVLSAGVIAVVALALALGLPFMQDTLVDERRAALIDPLTGVLNRRAFQMVADRERLLAGREGRPISVAYFDLDDLKRVNDAHGHGAGDRVLARFAASVASAVRATDVFARIGGDEFVLLLPGTDARQAHVVVDRVRRLLAEEYDDAVGPLTVSVGVATYRFPPETVDAILFGADDLMYEAKEHGGDTVVGRVVVGPSERWESPQADAPAHAPDS